MDDRLTFEEIVDRALERLLGGEDVSGILASYPGHASELAPVLRSAETLVSMPAYEAAPAPRAEAMRRMLDQVEASAVGTGSGGGIMSIFRSLRGRPLAFQGAAIGGALVLFGALGLGASAATGNAPEPVRDFLGISSSSTIRVELEGTIVSVEPSASTLTVSAGGDMRTVVVTGDTELSRSGNAIALTDLAAGQQVEVKGALQPDNSIVATRVQVEDGNGGLPTVAPSTPGVSAPTAVSTFDDRGGGDDDDGDGDDDHGGPGGDDDGDSVDDDSSGPGSDGNDDSVDDDSSGPGSDGNDDSVDDDSSGPGSGSDGTDDGVDDDNSDPGSGSDDGDDAGDSNSGSGGGDDDGGRD